MLHNRFHDHQTIPTIGLMVGFSEMMERDTALPWSYTMATISLEVAS